MLHLFWPWVKRKCSSLHQMDNNFGKLVGVFLAFGSGSYDRELKQQLF